MTKRERPDRRQILESKLKRGGALARRAAAAAAIALALAPLAQAERENAWSTRAIRTWGQALTEAGFFGSPRWATAALPASGSTNQGAIAYDITTDEFKGCDGSAWGALGGGSGDVTAASNIADNALVRGDGGAKGIQQSQAGGVLLDDNDDLIFEGTPDDFETTIAVADATADQTITFPDLTGTILLNATGSVFGGDSGAGGTIGAVPAPAAGDAAANKYLKADGTWATVSAGIGGSTGSTDRAVLVADGTGGATLAASGCTVSASGDIACAVDSATTNAGVTLATLTATTTGTGAAGFGPQIDLYTENASGGVELAGRVAAVSVTATDSIAGYSAIDFTGSRYDGNTYRYLRVGPLGNNQPVYYPGTGPSLGYVSDDAAGNVGLGLISNNSYAYVGLGNFNAVGYMYMGSGLSTDVRQVSNSPGLLFTIDGRNGTTADYVTISTNPRLAATNAIAPDLNIGAGAPESFTDAGGSDTVLFGGPGRGAGTPGALVFQTAATTASGTTVQTQTERMRIHTNGFVGVGSAAPAVRLDVRDTTNGEHARFGTQAGGYVTLGYNTQPFIGASTGTLWLYNGTNNLIGWNSGAVNVGTSTNYMASFWGLEDNVAGFSGQNSKEGWSTGESITLSTSGTTTNSAGNLAPANSIINAIACRITTTITTATELAVSVTGGVAFNQIGTTDTTLGTMTAGTTAIFVPPDHNSQYNASATTITLTTTGTPGAGVVRCAVHYRSFTAPTS